MADRKLVVSHSPHIRDAENVPDIMRGVLIALIPAVIAAVYFFGVSSLFLIVTCAATAVLTEAIWMAVRQKDVGFFIQDYSAALTGVLLGLTLPSTTPIWTAILGSIVAITIGKQIFGGLGFNIINPALLGRAFLTVSFPDIMTEWVFDGTTTATPLAGEPATYWELFIGSVGGSLGETSALALLIGGAYLLYNRYIDWRLPLGFFASVIVLALITGGDPIFQLLAGALLLGGFFMLTDPVTSPMSRKGRWAYAIGAGILTFLIREWGDSPGGVLYAILLMNLTVPLLDRFLPDRIFGEVKGK